MKMANSCKEDVCDWLRDAHAMEKQAEQLFSGQADRLEDYPGLRTRLESELNYIKKHQALLASRIEALGSSTSVIKDTAAKLVGAAQNASGLVVTDDPVKAILALHTFTQMAVGSYKILVAAAEAISDQETKGICQTILVHTETRAAWMETELDTVTKKFLTSKAA
jgi:ferritin-like metal-binding protein YciE